MEREINQKNPQIYLNHHLHLQNLILGHYHSSNIFCSLQWQPLHKSHFYSTGWINELQFPFVCLSVPPPPAPPPTMHIIIILVDFNDYSSGVPFWTNISNFNPLFFIIIYLLNGLQVLIIPTQLNSHWPILTIVYSIWSYIPM